MSKPIRWRWHTTQADRHVLLDHKNTAIAEATYHGTTESDKAIMVAAPLMVETLEGLLDELNAIPHEVAMFHYSVRNLIDEVKEAIKTIQALREEKSND